MQNVFLLLIGEERRVIDGLNAFLDHAGPVHLVGAEHDTVAEAGAHDLFQKGVIPRQDFERIYYSLKNQAEERDVLENVI